MNPTLAHRAKETEADRARLRVVVLLAAAVCLVPLAFSGTLADPCWLAQALAARVAAAVLLAAGAWTAFVERRPTRRAGILDFLVLGWVAWSLATTFHSASSSVSWRGAYRNYDGSLMQLHFAAMYFVASRFSRTAEDALTIFAGLACGGVAAASYVLLQAGGLDFFDWGFTFATVGRYTGMAGNPIVAGAHFALVLVGAVPALLAGSGESARRRVLAVGAAGLAGPGFWLARCVFAPGTTPDPAAAAPPARPGALAVLAVAAVLSLLAVVFAARRKLLLARVAALIGVSMLALRAMFETGSRAAMLAIAAAVVAAAGLATGLGALRVERRRLKRLVLAFGGFAAVFILLLGVNTASAPRMREALAHPLGAVDASRLAIWEPAWRMWTDRPWAGWGIDTFASVFSAYETRTPPQGTYENEVPQTAHCLPLQIACTTGAIGLSLALAILVAWFLAVVRGLRSTSDPPTRLALGGAIVGALAFGVYASLAITSVALVTIAWVLLGASAGIARRFEPASEVTAASLSWPARAGVVAASVIALAAIVATVPDYQADVLHRESLVLARTGDSARLDLAIGRAAEAVRWAPGVVWYLASLGDLGRQRFLAAPSHPGSEAVFAMAVAAHERAVTLDPRNVYWKANLARIWAARYQVTADPEALERSRRYYRDVVAMAPRRRPTLAEALDVAILWGSEEEADRICDGAGGGDVRLSGDLYLHAGKRWWDVAGFERRRGRGAAAEEATARALRALDRAEKRRPDLAEVPASQATIRCALGDDARCGTLIERALRLDPNNARALELSKKRGG